MKRIPRILVLMETARSFGRGVIQGIALYAEEHGPWSLYFQPGDLDQRLPPESRWKGDAVIGRVANRRVLSEIRRRRLPLVCLGGGAFGLPSYASTPTESIVQCAFDHLRNQGFTNLAFYGEDSWWALDRLEAFKTICRRENLPLQHCVGRADEDDTTTLTSWLRALPKSTGLLASDDFVGRRIIEVCHNEGIKIPEQLAVVGVDNDEPICQTVHPSLSSVEINAHRIGYESAAALDELMKNKTPVFVTIPPRGVIVRQSSDILAIEDPEVAAGIRYIRTHIREGATVEGLLDHIVLSRRNLEMRFRKQLGRSPHEEIIRTRLERARRMLLEADMKFSQIAAASGFSSDDAMLQAFKRCYGMSPSTYRQINSSHPSRS